MVEWEWVKLFLSADIAQFMAPRPSRGGSLRGGSTVGTASMMDRGLVNFTLRGRHWVAEMAEEIWRGLEMIGGGELMAKLSRIGCAHLLEMDCSSRCFGDTAKPPDESASYRTAAQRYLSHHLTPSSTTVSINALSSILRQRPTRTSPMLCH